MARNLILAMGALLWGFFAYDAIVHYATGDWMPPTVALAVGAVWLVVRWPRRRPAEAK